MKTLTVKKVAFTALIAGTVLALLWYSITYVPQKLALSTAPAAMITAVS